MGVPSCPDMEIVVVASQAHQTADKPTILGRSLAALTQTLIDHAYDALPHSREAESRHRIHHGRHHQLVHQRRSSPCWYHA